MDLNIIISYCTCFITLVRTMDKIGDDGTLANMNTAKPALTCAYCASPRSTTTQKEVIDALEQFLDVRGSHYPSHAIDPNCHRSRNISTIKGRHKCLSDYCYSVTFRDAHGNSLTLRGCAEYYIAVGNLKRNYCKRLTQTLDVVECVCKGTDVCPNSVSTNRPLLISLILASFVAFWWSRL